MHNIIILLLFSLMPLTNYQQDREPLLYWPGHTRLMSMKLECPYSQSLLLKNILGLRKLQVTCWELRNVSFMTIYQIF